MYPYDQIFQEHYQKLNPEQKKAVDQIEGPLMVLAGPGTGKTQILALRIAKILKETQMNPYNILCLTFTETAVIEMRDRLIKIIGPTAYYVKIYTFHSFCNDVIREFPEKFLFTRDLEPLTDIERIQIFRAIIDELPAQSPLRLFAHPYYYCRYIPKVIAALKREDINTAHFQETILEISNFLESSREILDDFLNTHGRDITEEQIRKIHERMQKILISRKDKAQVSIFLERFFDDYFEKSANLNQKEQKKARTLLKNDLKQFVKQVRTSFLKQKELLKVYQDYQQKLKERGRYDFEDMILFVTEKFKEDSELLSHYQEQYQYILVDEYQDTNSAQNEAVNLLGAFFATPNIFVVGDDKQSIYRFQGASTENMASFYVNFKDRLKVISLKENYRSSQIILDAADSLIKHNRHNIDSYIPNISTELRAVNGHKLMKIQLGEFENNNLENYFLAKKVNELIKNGVEPADIAIIYRNNRDADEIVSLFLRLKVPFRLDAGRNVLMDQEILKLIDFLSFINEMNSTRLSMLLNYDFLGFDALDLTKVIYFAGNYRKDLFYMLCDVALLKKAGVQNPDAFLVFSKKIADLKKDSANLGFSDFFDRVLHESGFLPYVLRQENKLELLNRLNSLFTEIKRLNRSFPRLTLAQFIEYVDLLRENELSIAEEPLETSKEGVRLMTAHKAKGLEFKHVFVIKCVDKHFGNVPDREKIKLPLGLSKGQFIHDIQEKNEEERRLFYVCLTRAKERVYLTYAKYNENGRPQSPSIFVTEIQKEYVEQLETKEIEAEAVERLRTVFLKVPERSYKEEHIGFLKGILRHYVMSVTHLNNYLECPLLFYYRNLLKVPAAKSKHLSFGTAVHSALRDLRALKGPSLFSAKDYLLSRFQDHLKKEILSEKNFRDILSYGQSNLSEYYDYYKDSFQSKVLVEYNFRSHRVHLDTIPLTGKLDKIEIVNSISRLVNVVDYKTGKPDSRGNEIIIGGSYRRQIAFYKLLCDLSPQFPYTMVSGEIDFIEKSKQEGTFKKFRMEISLPELKELKEVIAQIYNNIMNLKFLKDEGTYCGECEFCQGIGSRI